MNVCELRLEGAPGDRIFDAARWELFSFQNVRHVCRLGATDRIAVLYDGKEAVDAWARTLQAAGIPVSPVETAEVARAAA